MRNLMICTHTTSDPASRFRALQYIPHLEKAGWRVSHRPNRPPRPWTSPVGNWVISTLHERVAPTIRRLSRLRDIHDASSYDVVFVNRDLLAGDLRYEQLLVRKNPRVVFDFDDAIFLGEKAKHIGWICKNAAWVIAGNSYLADFARRFTDRVTVVPTVVETDRYLMQDAPSSNGPFRVGWCGSNRSIEETLFPYLGMLARLQKRLGFEFVIISSPRPLLPGSDLRWTYVEWDEQVETLLAIFFDIGIMPLVDNEFQRGKCACKLLQYLAAGLPVIASPVGVNRGIVDRGRCGFLARSERDWHQAIQRLMADPLLRREFGSNGRNLVEKEYSLEVWLPVLLDRLEEVAVGA